MLLPKRPISQLKPVNHSKQQDLRAYCPNRYIYCAIVRPYTVEIQDPNIRGVCAVIFTQGGMNSRSSFSSVWECFRKGTFLAIIMISAYDAKASLSRAKPPATLYTLHSYYKSHTQLQIAHRCVLTKFCPI
jgi:hypothetical protein